MGSPHGHKLHFHGHSWVHRLPAHVKLVALVAFMLTVVATPRDWYPVFAGYFLLLFVLVAVSHVPPTYLAKRMVVDLTNRDDSGIREELCHGLITRQAAQRLLAEQVGA